MGCHFLLQGNLPDPGIEPRSPAFQADALTAEPPRKTLIGSDGKEYACNAGDPGLVPGSGNSPGEGNSYPLQWTETSDIKHLFMCLFVIHISSLV